MEDLYEILGVPRGATQDEIKKAYRQLVRQYHPDTHPGDEAAAEKFQKINAAYSVLNDPEKRARYDQFGTEDGSSPFGNMGGFGGFAGMDLGDLFGDVFAQAFGGGRARRRSDPTAPRQGNSIELATRVTLLEAAQGVSRKIEIPRLETCKTCNGTGAKPGTQPETCPTCHGQGQVQQMQQSMFGQFVTITDCPTCGGRGKVIHDKCPDCKGEGRIRNKITREVKVPAGVERGTRLRIPGEGEAGLNGGPSGDLYILVDVAPDERFERDGADLHTRLVLTWPQAVMGGEVEIETLIDGKQKLSIPAGTAQDQVLKLRGKGMPRLRGSRGDMYAHVVIEVPPSSKLTEKQKSLISDLAQEMKAPIGTGTKGSGFRRFMDGVKDAVGGLFESVSEKLENIKLNRNAQLILD